ncbi:MAG: MMPL family transporter [Dehalococcoidales bacterium]|nr:MMPL family transporter [Dehalococcoidales bacterium]
MSKYASYGRTFYHWLGDFLKNHSRIFVILISLITLLLLFPLFLMQPTETASDNPTNNNTITWYEEVNQTFPSEIYSLIFIFEAENGDMLTQENLYALLQKQDDLKNSAMSPLLYESINSNTGTVTKGVYSLADAVNALLILQSGNTIDLSNATDLQVKQAVFSIFSNPYTSGMQQALSIKSTHEDLDDGVRLWESPALTIVVYTVKPSIIGDYASITGENYSGDIVLEYFGRDALDLFRSQQDTFRVWGVNIDMQLEIKDQGSINIPMLIAAIIIIMLIVAVFFRSVLITLICGSGLIMVLVWLMGFSNLIGIKNSTIVDLVVPIVVLVLGIDYAIHSIYRYREERRKGYPPEQALGNSTRRVGNALVTAMLTTIIAFMANAISNIESIVDFAVASSFAIFATYVILGLFAPTLVMWADRRKEEKKGTFYVKSGAAKRSFFFGKLVIFFTEKRYFTLSMVVLLTIAGIIGWTNLETKLEAKDALSPDCDFVIGLDKVTEHIGTQAGEVAIFYIRGDFTDHESLTAMNNLVIELDDNKYVARIAGDGSLNVKTPLLSFLDTALNSDYIKHMIEIESGTTITDNDNDGIPDTAEQLLAVYNYIIENGISLSDTLVLYTPEDIKEAFVYDDVKNEFATLISIGVPGTVEQAVVKESAVELNLDLDKSMKNVDSISFYGLTGNAYVRDAQFSAITDSMTNSFMIAIGACMLFLLVIFRSLRYSLITLIPVIFVVCWLYGLMYILGYEINMMTATIASISVGVGIDYCIHFTERFRQEFLRLPDKKKALLNTAGSTGIALLGSGLSTATGFAVLAFAPMPMFSTFGILTALMIAMSFMVAIMVLPCLLYIFLPQDNKQQD